jgi:hypothetical protein
MAATYTVDVFSPLDRYGSYGSGGDWGEHGPEFLDHRLALFDVEQRMVFGATTMRELVQILGSNTGEPVVPDPWITRMRSMPATAVATTWEGPLDWPDATVVGGDRPHHPAAGLGRQGGGSSAGQINW